MDKIEMDKKDKKLKSALNRLWNEIKKDSLLFGSFGFILTWLFAFMDKLKQWGISYADYSLLLELLESFISPNVLFFLVMSFIIVATIANTLSCLGCQCSKLEDAVQHIGLRLSQITSAIISFCGGVAVAALLRSIFTMPWKGVIFAGVVILFGCAVFAWSLIPYLFILVYELLDKWWAKTIMVVFILFLLPILLFCPLLHKNLWFNAFMVLITVLIIYCFIRRHYFHKKA